MDLFNSSTIKYVDLLFDLRIVLTKSRTAKTAVRPLNHLDNIIEDLNLQRKFHTPPNDDPVHN